MASESNGNGIPFSHDWPQRSEWRSVEEPIHSTRQRNKDETLGRSDNGCRIYDRIKTQAKKTTAQRRLRYMFNTACAPSLLHERETYKLLRFYLLTTLTFKSIRYISVNLKYCKRYHRVFHIGFLFGYFIEHKTLTTNQQLNFMKTWTT